MYLSPLFYFMLPKHYSMISCDSAIFIRHCMYRKWTLRNCCHYINGIRYFSHNQQKSKTRFYLKANELKITRRLSDSNTLSMDKDGLRASAYHTELRWHIRVRVNKFNSLTIINKVKRFWWKSQIWPIMGLDSILINQ